MRAFQIPLLAGFMIVFGHMIKTHVKEHHKAQQFAIRQNLLQPTYSTDTTRVYVYK
jgi:hypothetical protein